MNKKGICYTIASAILFGVTPLITMLIYALGASSITVVFYRSIAVVLILAIILYMKKISFRISYRELFNIAFVAVCGSGMTTMLLFSSYQFIDTGTATNLHFLYPIFVALLCRFVYKEKLGREKYIALAMAAIGMFLFMVNGKGGSLLGYGMAIASSLTYAFYMVYLEKSGLTHMNSYKLSFYIGIFIALETLLYHLCIPSITWVLPPSAYAYLILLAICSSFLAVIWLQKGILFLGSTTASLFCLFEPITSLLVGMLLLDEGIYPTKLIGSIFILAALAKLVLADHKQNPQTTE